MRIVNGELNSSKNDEMRMKYRLGPLPSPSDSVLNVTYLAASDTQNMHKHYLVKEATYVSEGQVEICLDPDKWQVLSEGQMVEYDLSEFHNMRAAAQSHAKSQILHPASGKAFVAVTVTFKWIPPQYKLEPKVSKLFLDKDWFPPEGCSPDFSKLSEEDKRTFWITVDQYGLRMSYKG